MSPVVSTAVKANIIGLHPVVSVSCNWTPGRGRISKDWAKVSVQPAAVVTTSCTSGVLAVVYSKVWRSPINTLPSSRVQAYSTMGPPRDSLVMEAVPFSSVGMPRQASTTVNCAAGMSAKVKTWVSVSEQPLADVTSSVKLNMPGPLRFTGSGLDVVPMVPTPSKVQV